ncbi:hypothetical protein [Pseudoalteromonas shioyasakiensis]|uniref:hypothetical protein n=1 Tax=Pseudoalteromonas shioyasakiensis TaxID=1190813 RepID=UPI001C3E1986|nr:hypothetical protein [Pseudoalteromonas shioyasakiensis]
MFTYQSSESSQSLNSGEYFSALLLIIPFAHWSVVADAALKDKTETTALLPKDIGVAKPEATKATQEIIAPVHAKTVPATSDTNLLSLGFTELCLSSFVKSLLFICFGGSLRIIFTGFRRHIDLNSLRVTTVKLSSI